MHSTLLTLTILLIQAAEVHYINHIEIQLSDNLILSDKTPVNEILNGGFKFNKLFN